ncbi:hypothetical protein ACIBTV_26675 [Micromonospora sp. NPDC049366]|uniref:hypothetical protein n=1 Tax=Micromonospora sp. NPDC049366 TaxID=3364271 RepID=UPI0037B46574
MIGLCVGQPSTYWNTFNAGNLRAFELCAVCPLPAAGECGPQLEPLGLIVAGIAYDDKGVALARCPKCHYPMPRRKGYRNGVCGRAACPDGAKRRKRQQARAKAGIRHKPSMFREQIRELTLARVRRADIAEQLRLTPRGVREIQYQLGLTGEKLARALAEHQESTTSRKAA